MSLRLVAEDLLRESGYMLPQGQPERESRALNMVLQMDQEGFGGCTNIGECAAVCPKQIPLDTISQLNRDLMKSLFKR